MVAKNERKKKKRELRQPSCQKRGEKSNTNLGNEVSENEGKKEDDLAKNGRKKNCGNGIAEMREKKMVAIDLWQCCCQKLEGEKKELW